MFIYTPCTTTQFPSTLNLFWTGTEYLGFERVWLSSVFGLGLSLRDADGRLLLIIVRTLSVRERLPSKPKKWMPSYLLFLSFVYLLIRTSSEHCKLCWPIEILSFISDANQSCWYILLAYFANSDFNESGSFALMSNLGGCSRITTFFTPG